MTFPDRLRAFPASARTMGFDLCLLVVTATLILLQSFRVFVPYLVFEIDQSERTTLAEIAVAVFASTFFGAVLFRLAGARVTLTIAVTVSIVARIALQLTESPNFRWMLGAVTVVGCFWLFIVILPQSGMRAGAGIAIAFLLDLVLRALRETLDLPWMPGRVEHLVTLIIAGAAAASAALLVRSRSLSAL